ncbi:OprD family porin [Pseudomonas sp. R5(2019)]|uniref:OprD family porin n=1 Tax=Pseudomonas sp. R5(2019) TaxID=2697566 RepID=UPI0014126318|nr:OprD family porin [Pseudomonas sp. R5(2019)]NBA93630.1 outer membrane porin, OprD family [Pseudomonas sp. R5(2019)]
MIASVRIGALGALITLSLSPGVRADFVEGSQLTLGLRNFYVDRDFKQKDAPKSRVGSWSQGFDLIYRSGYTDGPVQFGLDTFSQFAYRLDGGGGRSPDSVLPYDRSKGEPVRDYGRSGVTGKVRVSRTELRVGEQRPTLPVAYIDDSRQLMTTYEGATVESREWDKLTLNAGRFWKIATRESSNKEDIFLFGDSPSQHSDGLNFAGVRYEFTPTLNGTWYFGQLEDIYRQHYVALAQTLDLGNGFSLKNDVRYFHNSEDGSELSGRLDNRSLGLMSALRKGASTYTLGYQRMYGDDAYPLLNGYVPQPYLVNWSTLGFYKAEERSWQARYDYDFAAMGMPGLKMMVRYLRGTDIDRGANLQDNVESERNFNISYVVQHGPLKGVALEMRHIETQARYGAEFDENRLIATYTWKLF